jgi:hypothetical protein
MARRLAADPRLLQPFRSKSRTAAEFVVRPDRYRRHIETAYAMMWERWQRGERPKSFNVPPLDPGRIE